MSTKIRPPAVAGKFYPADPYVLKKMLTEYLDAAHGEHTLPKAIIVPHAGYIYSGPIAASAYKWLTESNAAQVVKRVILLGPSHYVPCPGLAAPDASAFDTPLGRVPIDQEAMAQISELSQVFSLDAAHTYEHSLEVHLPFLQIILDEFTIVPLAAGNVSPGDVAQVLDVLWGGPETLIVVSSDLSHFHAYQAAQALDQHTARAIETLHPEEIQYNHACGHIGIQGLLTVAQRKQLRVQRVDLRNSGDTAGTKDRVVGYGAWVFLE